MFTNIFAFLILRRIRIPKLFAKKVRQNKQRSALLCQNENKLSRLFCYFEFVVQNLLGHRVKKCAALEQATKKNESCKMEMAMTKWRYLNTVVELLQLLHKTYLQIRCKHNIRENLNSRGFQLRREQTDAEKKELAVERKKFSPNHQRQP